MIAKRMVFTTPERVRVRLWRAVACIALTLPAAVVAAEPASASECEAWSGDNGNDSAFVVDFGRNCSYISVRHKYDPVWSNYNYWTSWSGGTGDAYSTRPTAVLYWIQTRNY